MVFSLQKLKASFSKHCRLGATVFFLFAIFADAKSQCALACNQNVQVSLDQTGQVQVTAGLVAPFAVASCGGTFETTLFNLQNQPVAGNLLDCSMLNQNLQVKVRHVPTGNICYGSVVAKDFLPPQIPCLEKFIACTADTSAFAVGFPPISDNCAALDSSDFSRIDTKTDLPCLTLQAGQTVTSKIERLWQTTDGNGNTASCLQKIWVKRSTLADLVFPKNRDNFNLPSLNCSQNPTNLGLTGQPTVEGRPIAQGSDCELVVNFSDQTSMICGTAGKQILRSWTVADYCANTFTIHVQVIKVEDKTPPSIVPPPNLTVGTDDTACSATVSLPATATATDDCSTVQITPRWQFGTGFGPFLGVPMGDHIVEYVATDACGNSKIGTMLLTVVDDKAPFAVCKPTLQVALGAAGTSFLAATSCDNGSTDNCQLAPLSVSRDGQQFFEKIPFTCADIPTEVQVTLKIKDLSGNENLCLTKIHTNDNLKPTIQCPSNKTLNCSDSYLNTISNGSATALDNCGTPTISFSDLENLNACKVGSVVRTWAATDAAGNSATCQQTLTLNILNSLAVLFPADKTVQTCGSASDFAPAATGEPVLSGQSCQQPTVNFVDEILPGPQACFHILRKWKVIDWCVYQPGVANSAGIFEKTQLIKVFDTTAPVLVVPADLTVQASGAGCSAQVVVADATASDCSATVSFSNNSAFATAAGANASGQYPVGEHSVIFTATDGCGNSTSKILKIKILPCAAGDFEIRGSIKTEKDVAVAEIPVRLKGDGANFNEDCDATGQFQFDDVPGAQTYTLEPTNSTGNWLNGVTTFDLLQISRHILGIKQLDSPYKLIAADVNRSNSVTTNDIVQLRKLILGIFDTIAGNASWRFVPKNYQFPSAANPWQSQFPEVLLLQNLLANQANQDFVGIKIGDLNNSADASNPRSPRDTTFLFLENPRLKAGFPSQSAVKIGGWTRLEGFQFEFEIDTARVSDWQIEFAGGKIFEEKNLARRGSGRFSVSWDDFLNLKPAASDSLLFTLHLLPTADASLRDVLKINQLRLPAEAYPSDGGELEAVALRFVGAEKFWGNFELSPAFPNPFQVSTTLRFELPTATDLTLLCSDAFGKVVFEQTRRLPRGWNDWQIFGRDLPQPGVYSFLLKSLDTPPAGGKLIFLER